jgi:predicted nucleotide-binding protein (sugar kinase/HSP70/actin superfamily)
LAKRIGICRALHAYHHYAFWRTFFEELGWEVVLSASTDRPAIEQGVRLSPSELCLPAKAFLGQVARLKDKVDFLFLPRIVCSRVTNDWFFGCPKAIALPDLTRAVFSSLPPIVEPILDERLQSEEQAFRKAIAGLDGRADFRRAFRRARTAAEVAVKRTREDSSPLHVFSRQGTRETRLQTTEEDHVVKIGVVGHTYLLYDPGLSLDLLDKIKQAGARPIVVFPTDAEVEVESQRDNVLNWYYELELLASARRLLEVERVDGLLLVTSFACGTGAVTNELIQREAVHRSGVPTILVLLDEHTGEAGLVTRIESFVDVLRLRRA